MTYYVRYVSQVTFLTNSQLDIMAIQQVNTVKTADLTTCRQIVANFGVSSTKKAAIPKDYD